MSQRNEHLELCLEELERYGLKGEISDRSKHLELSWNSPLGRRFVIAPKTPSDWRSALNMRSDLRKLLRADNLQPKPISDLSFQKAMSLPKQPVINKELLLQKEVDALTDLVFDLQSQLSLLQSKLNSMRVVARIEFDQVQQIIENPQQQDELVEEIEAKFINGAKPFVDTFTGGIRENPYRYGSTQYQIAACLTEQYKSVDAIVKESGVGRKKYVQTTLSKAKTRGYAENGLYGMWRRKP